MIKTSRLRNRSAGTLIELAASLTLIIPIVFFVLFATVEMTFAYLITNVLGVAAQISARDLALLYPTDPTVAKTKSSQDALVFDNIRHPGVVQSSEQFDDATFDTSADPPLVSVTVHYTSGNYGLPIFPTELLGLDKLIHLQATSVYRLEEN